MKLIVGLGNPGSEYGKNRHNVGFLFVEQLASRLPDGPSWKFDKYLMAEVSKPGAELTLAKPQTFMNKSGESVRKLLDHFGLVPADLIVVHDDLDIPLGKFRIVKGYGPKLHNGLESIEQHLHTADFLRIRIGVDARQPDYRVPGIDYVLQDFSAEERLSTVSLFPEIVSLLKTEHGIKLY